jgi:5-methylcytosine-specific restriction endonuclease McrBC regulatory subunit McrC
MRAWKQGRLRSMILEEGLDAIAWTVDERGLAGLCDLHGLPWSMSMETFFEAWVESVVQQVARRIGGVVRTGRQRQTQVPIMWDPPYQGSQRFLLPDVCVETAAGAIIVDAKYKDHWEDLAVTRWGELEEKIRERHRADLLQILAYTSVLDSDRLAACLIYPCRRSTWESLHERNRLFHRGTVGVDNRTVQLLLTALPMDAQADIAVDLLATELGRMLEA